MDKASKKTVSYLHNLLNDNGFGTHIARMAFIQNRIPREVHGTSDLYQSEASILIDELKDLKARQQTGNDAEEEEE